MSKLRHVHPVSRPMPAATHPTRLLVLDIAIAVLNFVGRVKFG